MPRTPNGKLDRQALAAAQKKLLDQQQEQARLASDKGFQEDLQELIEDLSEATDRLKGEGKKKGRKTRNRVILLTGVTLGVLYNPWTGQATREWIMERIAGGDGNGLEDLSSELSRDISAGAESVSSNESA
mgnify:CR=1 FL=1